MMNLTWIVSKVQLVHYFFSQHADEERMNDNLMISEVEEAILNGSILETYPNDNDSCLVVGFTRGGKPIHIVCGQSGDKLVIITVYIPKPPKFINPYERKK